MKRIAWIDILKLFGMISIYYWHLCEGTGRGYQFILLYHVPLFFFLSGCTESLSKDVGFLQYAGKKVKGILLPFYFFAILSMFLVIVVERCGLPLIGLMVKQILLGGIRNRIFAYSLWFLTCLFSMSLLFFWIKQWKKKSRILLSGVVLFILAARFLPYKPNMIPLLPYNVDCALYYILYYCIGYCAFPYLQKFLDEKGRKRNSILAVSGGLCAVYAICLFFGKNALFFLEKIPVVRLFSPVITALLLIWLFLVAAFVLQPCLILQKMGAETLYMCGNEFIIKTLATIAFSALGIGMEWRTPFGDMVYVIVLLVLVHVVLVPLEKPLL